MNREKRFHASQIFNNRVSIKDDPGQQGTAIVIALFVLVLLGVFVALALTRTATEAQAVGNETADARASYAAQASLEMMTRNFVKVFKRSLNPTNAELDQIRNGTPPGFTGYDFTRQTVTQTTASQTKQLDDGDFAGLYSLQDNWKLTTTVTDPSGVQVEMTRNIRNNRIPIFQFGIFYNDDLELYRPPRFSFGGRVHTNGSFYLSPGSDRVDFDSRITVYGNLVTQTWRNGDQSDINNNNTYIRNAAGNYVQLLPTSGSVLNTTNSAENAFTNNFLNKQDFVPNADAPMSRLNPDWATLSAPFGGNLKAAQDDVKRLNLPLNLSDNVPNVLSEIIKRGKNAGDLANSNYPANNGAVAPVATPDNPVMQAERYANKTGIRVSLADRRDRLPGCAGVAAANVCGVRLDGAIDGRGAEPAPTPTPPQIPVGSPTAPFVRGYRPLAMRDGYQATRLNGTRFYNNETYSDGTKREVWIKIETVATNPANNAIITADITEDILSLGVTEESPCVSPAQMLNLPEFAVFQGIASNPNTVCTASARTGAPVTDSRSIVKLQRYVIPNGMQSGSAQPAIPDPTPNPSTPSFLTPVLSRNANNEMVNNAIVARFRAILPYTPGSGASIIPIVENGCLPQGGIPCAAQGTVMDTDPNQNVPNATDETYAHLKAGLIKIPVTDPVTGVTTQPLVAAAIVPFPIQMYDAREGAWLDSNSATYYDLNRVNRRGVMSLVDIDVANLRRFLNGEFNNILPLTTDFAQRVKNGLDNLKSTDIPSQNGWVLYVSDRRGDTDFDGEFDMEDVYNWNYTTCFSPSAMEPGEDVNGNGALDMNIGVEAPSFCERELPSRAAVVDNRYYRRGVRLINGSVLPGVYNAANASNTRGFTVASENGVYVQGNYNATGVVARYPDRNTPDNEYLPYNTANHIPASVVADSVTILSNNWNDSQSFASPYNQRNRNASDTTMRFAMIAGDTIASKRANPHQGGNTNSERMNGGVHNFKRFLERWTSVNFDFSGSLINLYNSENNNGSFKCCNTVYNPPNRNWVFDRTFLDPTRLPPGTPFFQFVQTTGFQRDND